MKKTYHGSCHCGAIRYECVLDFDEGLRRCNCSFCRRTRMLKTFTKREDFKLLSGEDHLVSYRADTSGWPVGDVDHYFCKRCGIRPFSRGYHKDFMGHFYCINAGTLDDVSEEEFSAAPVIYENGLADDFFNPPPENLRAHL
ncbi:GFA family protein [Shinella kummerowiae]|jgi:hypothetical protein|uniref:GFA family protein n=1 Tax=Shinella kummerowiae TaxID=417745 RepID=UPI0021B62705|nr:GFA family protein [Shinella kummerowiae]MCT7663190.1 GFA family protein [Shinella kummerowiae]